MTLAFPYLTGDNLAATEPTTAVDVSQEEGETELGTNDVGDVAAAEPLGADDEEQFDEDADAQEFVFPNLEQDVATREPLSLARTRLAQRCLIDQQELTSRGGEELRANNSCDTNNSAG
jgi:hypothetical protein